MKALILFIFFLPTYASAHLTILEPLTPREVYIRTVVNIINDYCKKWHSGIPENQERIYRCQIEMKSKCAFGGPLIKIDACEAQTKVENYERLITGIDQQQEVEEEPIAPVKPVLAPSILFVIWSDGKIEDLKNPTPPKEPEGPNYGILD